MVSPDNASDKRVEFTTTKGTIKDGYITLENLKDLADVTVSLWDGSASDTCKVLCVQSDIPVQSISALASKNDLEVVETETGLVVNAIGEGSAKVTFTSHYDESITSVIDFTVSEKAKE